MVTKEEDFTVDFIGVGAPKCATEWIVHCLREHPQIDLANHKEINFFLSPTEGLTNFVYENIRIKTLEAYKKEFAWKPNAKKGEFSNHYLFDIKALEKIKKAFPNVKIIISLRDPVEYLYSIFWYMKFSNAYHKIPDTFEEGMRWAISDDLYHIDHAKFDVHVGNCFDIFGKENTHVIILSDIKRFPKKVIHDLLAFIGVDTHFLPENTYKHVNKTQQVRSPHLMKVIEALVTLGSNIGLRKAINWYMNTSNPIRVIYKRIIHKNEGYPPINKKTEVSLRRELEESIQKLEGLLSRDLSIWKNSNKELLT